MNIWGARDAKKPNMGSHGTTLFHELRARLITIHGPDSHQFGTPLGSTQGLKHVLFLCAPVFCTCEQFEEKHKIEFFLETDLPVDKPRTKPETTPKSAGNIYIKKS